MHPAPTANHTPEPAAVIPRTQLDMTLAALKEHPSWRIVLLKPRAKKPEGKVWEITADIDRISRHVERGGNLGLLCQEETGIVVLDEDDSELWSSLVEALGPLTPWVKTGSGKRHYYVKWHPGLPAKLTFNGKKVGEIQRGPGQQHVVLPPSIHPDTGKPYEWLVSPEDSLPEMPDEWIAYLSDPVHLNGNSKHDTKFTARPEILESALQQPGARDKGSVVKFQCPACREEGHDKHQDNAAYFSTYGKWGCALGGREHWESIGKMLGAFKSDRTEATASPEESVSTGKPRIVVNDHSDWSELTDKAFASLVSLNAHNPSLFQRGIALVRVRQDEEDRPLIEPMSENGLKGYMADSLFWVKKVVSQNGDVYPPVPPPESVVKTLLARSSWPGIPSLRDIVRAPIFAKDGTIITQPGYHQSARLWYAEKEPLDLNVPALPTQADVDAARDLLVSDLLGDFPFDSDASLAHALACLLLPFVREMIQGPTPLHLFSAPTPGSGKGLLVDVVSLVVTGSAASVVSVPRDDEEMRKRITSQLRRGTPIVVLDNITKKLEFASLCSVLTATEWEDRILGHSEMSPRLPNRSVWAATANNPELSVDIARRAVTCQLDPGVECPWERKGFKHEDLRTWVTENRGALVSAALTLVQAWISAGRPKAECPAIGSFEAWARVISGVLEVAGVKGLLTNYRSTYEVANQESGEWSMFIEAWYTQHGTKGVPVKELNTLARDSDLLADVLGDGTDQSQRVRLGHALTARRGRVYAGRQIKVDPRGKHGVPYRLTEKAPVGKPEGDGRGRSAGEVYEVCEVSSSPLGDDTPFRALTGRDYIDYTDYTGQKVNGLGRPFTTDPGVDPEIEGDEV